VGEAMANLARYQMEAERPGAADTLFRGAIAILEKIDDRSILLPLARQDHGNLCLDLNRYEEAETLLLGAAARLDSSNAAMRPYWGDNLVARARLHVRRGRHAAAESLLAVGMRVRREDLAETDASLLDPWLCAAEIRWLAGQPEAALELVGRAARCGATDADVRRYPELLPLRTRPGYPFVSSP